MAVKLSNFAGKGGGGSSGGHIAANNIFSNATLRVLDLISEGQIGGLVNGAKSVFFDDVPIQNENGSYNFENIFVDWVNGTPDQKIIEGFGDVVTPQPIGQEVKYGFPVTHAVESAEADKIRIVVSLPSLYGSDKKGNIFETSVRFRFELSIGNGGNWQQLGDFEIKGKQNSEYQRSYEFALPKLDQYGVPVTKWLVRMTRLSEDSNERYSARTSFDTLYVVTSSRLNYPYSAIVGVKASAENLNKIPTRSYLIDGMIIKIPSNYDPKTNRYNGVWDGTFKLSVSSNPAWILYALLTNERWGLGNFIKPEQVNKAKLYEIGRYCDEEIDDGYGKKEKRFSINTQIQERSDAYRLISDISAVFRGMAFWAGGMTSFTCDMPTDPSMLYTPSNVINGEFTYSGSSRNDRHSVALVTWNDPEQNYKQVVEYVEDAELIAKYGIRQAELTAFGCTSRAQAIRAGKWILYTESYESEIITFNVSIDSALVLPGDVIKIQDPSYAGKRLGGRLVEVTETSATLDGPVNLSVGNDSIISMRLSDGSFIERDVIVSYDGERTKVEWYKPLEKLPLKNSIWIISEATLRPLIARVVNITQGEQPNTFQITAVSHEPKKYDLIEKGIKFEKDPTTTDPLIITPPTKCNVQEEAVSLGLGYISSKLIVTWLSGQGNVSFELKWRREGDNETEWETVTTRSRSVTIADVQKGMYHFKLRALGLLGNRSDEVEFYYAADGQYVTPLDVTNFKVIKRPSYLDVKWEPVKEAFAYEVRCGQTWDTAEVLIASFAGTSFVHYQYEAGTYYYHIRSISATGEYSPNVTTFRLDLKAPAMPEDLAATVSANRIDFTWKSNKEDDLSHYELREGQNWESGIKVAESKVNQMSIPGGSSERRKFWLKAIALPKIYSEQAAWLEINIGVDETRNLIIKHDARSFGWTSNKINVEKSGDDIAMLDGKTRAEYIHKMSLSGKITAQNSFFTSVSTAVLSDEDTETWETAKWAWNSPQAERAWRLGGDSESIVHENQISRHIGIAHENECFGLDEKLDSERGVKPTVAVGEYYDWGRYSKGLKVSDVTGVTWETPIITRDDNGLFKFSSWIKTKQPEGNTLYTFFKFGNKDKYITVDYNSSDKAYRLTDSDGQVLTVHMEMLPDQHVFVAMSQSKTNRVFAIGVLGEETKLVSGLIEPIGTIDYFKLGTEAI